MPRVFPCPAAFPLPQNCPAYVGDALSLPAFPPDYLIFSPPQQIDPSSRFHPRLQLAAPFPLLALLQPLRLINTTHISNLIGHAVLPTWYLPIILSHTHSRCQPQINRSSPTSLRPIIWFALPFAAHLPATVGHSPCRLSPPPAQTPHFPIRFLPIILSHTHSRCRSQTGQTTSLPFKANRPLRAPLCSTRSGNSRPHPCGLSWSFTPNLTAPLRFPSIEPRTVRVALHRIPSRSHFSRSPLFPPTAPRSTHRPHRTPRVHRPSHITLLSATRAELLFIRPARLTGTTLRYPPWCPAIRSPSLHRDRQSRSPFFIVPILSTALCSFWERSPAISSPAHSRCRSQTSQTALLPPRLSVRSALPLQRTFGLHRPNSLSFTFSLRRSCPSFPPSFVSCRCAPSLLHRLPTIISSPRPARR